MAPFSWPVGVTIAGSSEMILTSCTFMGEGRELFRLAVGVWVVFFFFLFAWGQKQTKKPPAWVRQSWHVWFLATPTPRSEPGLV